ncbi:class I adenylate-forming enzyme family protein [Streptomyces sp. G5(2025)]|uniref:class I adenylate-forming enzyme family protein n=1 Tax=Streptomyces sp. G5(2025) TaxID=3406628 RepID=UPI003C21D620
MTEQQFGVEGIGDLLRRVEEIPPSQNDDPLTLDALVERFAALPAEPGSVVVISLPNSARLLRIFFAVSLAGHTPVMLAPSTPPSRVRDICRHMGAYALIRTSIRPTDYGLSDTASIGGVDLAVFTDWQYQRHGRGHVILMTSGTSGMATGCLHSVDSLLRNARRHAASVGQTEKDTVLVSLPVFYSFGLVAQVLGCLVSGASMILAGPPFSVTNYVETITRHSVTVSALTPIQVKSVVGVGEELPAPLRTLSVGGQALDPSYVSRLVKLNPELGLYLTYGLTEAGPRVSTLAAHREHPDRYRSVGLPLDGVEVLTRESSEYGERELLVRSDTIYRKRVGEIPLSKRGELIEEGLLATGDMGYVDDDGYVYVSSRRSDFAMVRGEKVSLATVRKAAESLPNVVRAAARVMADDGNDDDFARVGLDVYVNDLDVPTEAEVQRSLRALLTRNERPGEVRIHPLRSGEFHK